MRRSLRELAGKGAQGLLLLLGSAVAACGAQPVYGAPDAAYGMPACFDDSDCKDRGEGWYCDKSGWSRCRPQEPDAGTPDDAG